MKELWRRLTWMFRRGKFERDLDEELRHHLALKAAEPGGALFGNVTLLKEESRAMWAFTFWEQLGQDIRYGLRAMRANRLFTAMAVVSLGLGIGANTAIYSFMDAILLRALPVKHPEELVILNWRSKQAAPPIVQSHSGTDYDEPGGGTVSPNLPYPAYEVLRDNNHVFSSLFGHFGAYRLNIVIDGQAELGDGRFVTGDFFTGLGISQAAGRLLSRDDDRPGATPVAVITHDYWRKRFGASPSAIGKTILINEVACAIAGVAAPGFTGVKPDEKPSLFLPMASIGRIDAHPRWREIHDGTFYWIEAMGRLKPGATLAQAQAELAPTFGHFVESTITKERERSNPPSLWAQEGGSGVDSIQRQYSKPLWILMTMALLILTIACANIANLLLARSAARRREIAVRISLGAGRLRVVRQLMTESVMLAIAGGAAGMGVAAAGIRLLQILLTNGKDNFAVHVGLDWRVLSFTLLTALLTGLLFGLAPAIQATQVDVAPALKESRAGAVRTRGFGLAQALVVSQIAISLLLVAGAGLFVRSLANLHSVQLGFNSEHLLTFTLDAGSGGYKGPALKHLNSDLRERFAAVAGVSGATMSDLPLVAGASSGTSITVPGIPKPPEGQRGSGTSFAQVGPSFFETMQIPILTGRAIDEHDTDEGPAVAVVNEIFAKKYFPGVNPVGRHFRLGNRADDPDLEIVGVSKTARYNSLRREIPPVTYIAMQQVPNTARPHQTVFELRTAGDPMALANTVRQIVHERAPQVPVADVTTQALRIESTILQEKIFARLCTCFGALALVMACVGLYGTMAYTVARRTNEIGIRIALGAERRRIVWMVLRQVLAMSITGLAIGFAAAWETTAFVKSFLFELKPNDPMTLGGAVGVLIVCALLAGYAPAWRASRTDPMVALRHE